MLNAHFKLMPQSQFFSIVKSLPLVKPLAEKKYLFSSWSHSDQREREHS